MIIMKNGTRIKRTVKQITALVCAAAAAISFSACGKKQDNANDGGVTDVKVWTQEAGSKAFMTNLVNEWNSKEGKEKGIRIVYEVLTGNAEQQIDVALQSKTAADIITASNLEKRVGMDYLQAIDELDGGQEYIDTFKGEGDRWKIDGHYYTVPSASIVGGLLYNKDMFKKAGIVDENGEPTPPKTYAELREYAARLTNAEQKEYGIIYPGKSLGTWYPFEMEWSLMGSTGTDGFDPKTNQYDYSGLEPIMQTIIDIKNDGSCYPGTEAIDADPARAKFAEGNIGMKYGISWDVAVLTDQFPAKCDWGVAPMPVENEAQRYKQKMEIWNGYSIVKGDGSKDMNKIFEVYKWLCGEEVSKKRYEAGLSLPWDSEIIENADDKNAPEQWRQFAELMKISTTAPLAVKIDTTGATSIQETFMSEVWNGTADNIHKVVSDWTKDCNDGIKVYKDNNPDYDYSTVDNSGFDPSYK